MPTYMPRPLAGAHVHAGAHGICPPSLREGEISPWGDRVLLSPTPALVNFKLFPGSSVSPGEEALLCATY